jgi:Tol biopolymer transport system component
LTKLSDGKSSDVNPQYSPNGKLIAYRSLSSASNVIKIMNADGSGAKAVSSVKGNAANQAWSPDNALLAYQSNADGNFGIYVYELSSSRTRKVTDTPVASYAPTWRCGGNILIFTSEVGGIVNLYSAPALPMDAQPLKPQQFTQLTFDKVVDRFPLNSPSVEDSSYRSQVGMPGAKPQSSN